MYSYIHVDCPRCDGEKVFQVMCEAPSFDCSGGCEVGMMDPGYEGQCSCTLDPKEVERLEALAVEVYMEPVEPNVDW